MSPVIRKIRKPPIVIQRVSVDRDYAAQVLETALDYPPTYWCEIVGIERRLDLSVHAVLIREFDFFAPTGRARREKKILTVRVRDVQAAIAKIVKGLDGAEGEIRKQVLDGSPDGPRADAVLQVAALGEVRYS